MAGEELRSCLGLSVQGGLCRDTSRDVELRGDEMWDFGLQNMDLPSGKLTQLWKITIFNG